MAKIRTDEPLGLPPKIAAVQFKRSFYLRIAIVKHALDLPMAIGEIIEDNAYFARRFRQFFRLSPRDYRSTSVRS